MGVRKPCRCLGVSGKHASIVKLSPEISGHFPVEGPFMDGYAFEILPGTVGRNHMHRWIPLQTLPIELPEIWPGKVRNIWGKVKT